LAARKQNVEVNPGVNSHQDKKGGFGGKTKLHKKLLYGCQIDNRGLRNLINLYSGKKRVCSLGVMRGGAVGKGVKKSNTIKKRIIVKTKGK